jgi:N-acetyl-anhydromuramyl-L-alanine amidase AmpD
MFLETYEVNIKLKQIPEDFLDKVSEILAQLKEYGIEVDEGVYYTEENGRDCED